jgi:hypothetical protein
MMSLMICVILTQYCSGDKIERNEMGGACSRYAGKSRCIQDFVGETEGTRPLGRPKRKGEDNIKMDLQEVGCEGMDWIDVARDRGRWRALVYAAMNLWVP